MILEEENTFLPVIIDKSMMLLILILTIIIFPVPNKISRFYWRTCYDYQYDEIKNIYVAKQFCDMRKQIDGLALIVTSQFNMNVLDHSLFIFTKERRKAPRFSHGDIRRKIHTLFTE